jgi:FAD/FMN-containing dehydrogenase
MFLEVLGALMEDGTIADAVIAQSEQQAQGFWEMRDDVISIAVALNPMKSFDVSMGIAHMEAYINSVTDALAASEPDAKLLSFGHLGDENIHVLIGPVQNPKAVEEIVYGPLRAIGGSVSAEHGIGLEKRAFLSYSRNETEISVMRRVKTALDPDGLMNPGKLL